MIEGYIGQDATIVGDGERTEWRCEIDRSPPIKEFKAFNADGSRGVKITTQNTKTGQFSIEPPIPYGEKIHILFIHAGPL